MTANCRIVGRFNADYTTVIKRLDMNNDIVILENQVVIMEGILNGFWDSMTGRYEADPDYIKELKDRIMFTKARIIAMS